MELLAAVAEAPEAVDVELDGVRCVCFKPWRRESEAANGREATGLCTRGFGNSIGEVARRVVDVDVEEAREGEPY